MKIKSNMWMLIAFGLFILNVIFVTNLVTNRMNASSDVIVEGWISPQSINYIEETNKRIVTSDDYLQTHGGQKILYARAGECVYIVNADTATDRLFVLYFGDNNFCESEVVGHD